MGTKSVDEAIDELNERYNRGLKVYFENNPDEDINKYINPQWSSVRNGE